MSTLANITSLNLSLQTGGAALAVKSAKRLVAPSRTVYVYAGADGLPPNFTTPADALTYALSLDPSTNEPVVVRMFAKADGTPYDLTGLDPWEDYANAGILFVSDFIRLNVTTTLPTTLPEGVELWYRDGNGVETLWVGHADGSAWPSVGYKAIILSINQAFTGTQSVSVRLNQTDRTFTPTRSNVGVYAITFSQAFTASPIYAMIFGGIASNIYTFASSISVGAGETKIDIVSLDYSGNPIDIGSTSPRQFNLEIRVYPPVAG